MMKFKLPMQLQYFAEQDDTAGTGTDDKPVDDTSAELNDDKPTDDDPEEHKNDGDGEPNPDNTADEIVKKLQHRIGEEQGKKNQLAEQLEKTKQELEKLKNGGKDPKPKTPEQLEIDKLRKTIQRRDTIDKTTQVFTESGLTVPKEIIDLVVSDKDDETYQNAKTLIDFMSSLKDSTEQAVQKKYQKGHIPADTKHQKSTTSFGKQVAAVDQDQGSLKQFM